MKKILIIVNKDTTIYNFRIELVYSLIENNYVVYILVPKGDHYLSLEKTNSTIIYYSIDRHSINPFNDIKTYRTYKKTIKTIKPDIVLTYTIKPNIYGGLAAKKMRVPYIANITGLGTAVENKGFLQKITTFLYKKSFKKINHVFFQNNKNKKYFKEKKIVNNNYSLLPGSGVNLKKFDYSNFSLDNIVKFIFIGRLIKEKGIDYYLETAKYIKDKYPNTEFHIAGAMEESYNDKITEYIKKGIVNYHGLVNDLPKLLKEMHCTIHPTYYPEGMSNVLLESAAMGKPIIGTNRSGVKEIIDYGINGYLVEMQNQQQLNDAVEKFLNLSFEEKEEMGRQGRLKVEREFDRNIVVDAYLEKIEEILNKEN